MQLLNFEKFSFRKDFFPSLSVLAAALAMFAFGLDRNLMNIFFIAWLVAWGVEILSRGRNQHFARPDRNNIQLYFLLALSVWMLISIFWSENTARVFRMMELRMPLLLVPLFALFGTRSERHFRKILLLFVAGTVVGTIVILCRSYINSHGDMSVFPFLYNNYRHRTYFGICQLFSIIILVYLQPVLVKKTGNKFLCYFCSACVYILFMLAIYLSEGRMTLIIGFAITISMAIAFLWRKVNKILIVASAAILLVAGLLTMMNHPRMKGLQLDKERIYGFDPRPTQWECAAACIRENNIWIGVGLGDHTDIYRKKWPVVAEARGWGWHQGLGSAHNMWLDGVLEYGLVGVLIFAGIFASSFFGLEGKRRETIFVLNTTIMWLLFMMIEIMFFGNTQVFLCSLTLLSIYWVKKYPLEE